MFNLFKRTPLDANVQTYHGPFEWSPVALTELIAAVLRQMNRTGRFMGALDARKGFQVRTMADGSEQAVSARMQSRAIVADHDVSFTFSGADACKVATRPVATSIQSYLGQTVNWSITQEDGMTIWRGQVPVRGAVALILECRAVRPSPDLAELTGPCTELVMQLRKLN